jgi:hypothetical protein
MHIKEFLVLSKIRATTCVLLELDRPELVTNISSASVFELGVS